MRRLNARVERLEAAANDRPDARSRIWRESVRAWQERLTSGIDPGPAPTPWGADEEHWRHRLAVSALLDVLSDDDIAANRWPSWATAEVRASAAEIFNAVAEFDSIDWRHMPNARLVPSSVKEETVVFHP